MIASRCLSLSRFDRLLIVADALNALSNPFSRPQVWYHGQRLNCTWKMSSRKNRLSEIDRHRKQKAVVHVWRPISTLPGSHKEQQKNTPFAGRNEQIKEESITDISMTLTETSAVGHDNHMEDLEGNTSESHGSSALPKSGSALEQVVEGDAVLEMGCTKADDLDRKDKGHSVSLKVDSSLIHFIKGKGGSMQKQIEGDLGVKIVFPSSKEDKNVVIKGTIEGVAKASKKIASIIEEVVKSPKLDYSHFISLPLAVHSELVEKLNSFQNSILGDAADRLDDLENESNEDTTDDEDNQPESQKVSVNLEVQNEKEQVRVKIEAVDDKTASRTSTLSDMGIERSIFIKPKTFHLTVLMLKLWNEERVAAAAEVLQRISSKVQDALENQPVTIRLRGLMRMKGSPAKARVVYIPVREIGGEGRLLRACQVIIDAYVEAGLVLEKDAQQSLKLHATLLNARHRRRKDGKKKHDSFDARHIFRVYDSEDWGEYHLPEVHLSQRFKFDESGYYHCCTSIPLPEKLLTD